MTEKELRLIKEFVERNHAIPNKDEMRIFYKMVYYLYLKATEEEERRQKDEFMDRIVNILVTMFAIFMVLAMLIILKTGVTIQIPKIF